MGSRCLHSCGQCRIYKTTSLQSMPSPRKGRENREKMRERGRLTYRSGPQGKPDPAGVLTCQISMSRTQPDKTISRSTLPFSFISLLLYINFMGQKKSAFHSHLTKDASPFCLFSFSGTRTHNIYPPQGCRDPQMSAALQKCLCISQVCERSQAVSF